MKEKILEFLKQQDGFISGQRICDELGVSRTAVWKYMNSLKKEGYEIESVTRKGYRLLQSPDLLTTEEILSSMKEAYIPGELCCFESIVLPMKKQSAGEKAVHRMEVSMWQTSRLTERDEEEEPGYLRQEKMFSLPYCCGLNCR